MGSSATGSGAAKSSSANRLSRGSFPIASTLAWAPSTTSSAMPSRRLLKSARSKPRSLTSASGTPGATASASDGVNSTGASNSARGFGSIAGEVQSRASMESLNIAVGNSSSFDPLESTGSSANKLAKSASKLVADASSSSSANRALSSAKLASVDADCGAAAASSIKGAEESAGVFQRSARSEKSPRSSSAAAGSATGGGGVSKIEASISASVSGSLGALSLSTPRSAIQSPSSVSSAAAGVPCHSASRPETSLAKRVERSSRNMGSMSADGAVELGSGVGSSSQAPKGSSLRALSVAATVGSRRSRFAIATSGVKPVSRLTRSSKGSTLGSAVDVSSVSAWVDSQSSRGSLGVGAASPKAARLSQGLTELSVAGASIAAVHGSSASGFRS